MITWLNKTRYLAIIMVVAVVIGTVMMIGVGCYYTFEALKKVIGLGYGEASAAATIGAKLAILKAVDSFLFAIVLLYLGFGTYFLAFDPAGKSGETDWLEVKSVAQMKKTLLEVIVVLVAILFLQALIEQASALNWLLLVYPAAIVALAIALKLIPFEH